MSTTDTTDGMQTYRSLLRTIHHNTGDPQPVCITARTLWTHAVSHGSQNQTEAVTAIQAARENGHVVRWRNGDGQLCYALTADGIDTLSRIDGPGYGVEDTDALRDVIETEAEREDPDRDVIGWANRQLAEIRDAA